MILTLLQYIIVEKCIDVLFKNITENFNTKPVVIVTSINDFHIGQRFSSINVIGEGMRLTNVVVISINKYNVDTYVDIRDELCNRYAINSTDISSMRFYI